MLRDWSPRSQLSHWRCTIPNRVSVARTPGSVVRRYLTPVAKTPGSEVYIRLQTAQPRPSF